MKPRRFASAAAMHAAMKTDEMRGQVWSVRVMHDDWCSMPDSGTCNCSPEFEVREGTVETLVEAARLEAEWRRSRTS
jgi:hypothetical protein